MPPKKQTQHLKRMQLIIAERRAARKALKALGVTSLDGCHNEAVDPQASSASSVETSKLVKEEGPSVSSDEEANSEDGVPETTSPERNDVGEEEEVAIPLKQLKTSAKARVIDKPKPKPKRIIPLKPRPRFPSSSFCFVCVDPVYKPIDPLSKVTKADCSFLIKEMLELSKLETDHYLHQIKEPETLIGLCVKCLEVIREAVKLRKQISELEMGMRAYQRQIVKAIKGTELNSFSGVCNRPMEIGAMREKRVAIENLLRFVSKRKYFPVLSRRATVRKKISSRPLSSLDAIIQKQAATVTSAPAPAHDIKAGQNHPISQIVQKKLKTIPAGKTSWIISTPGPNKKMYLVRPKSATPKTSGKPSSSTILKPSSDEIPIPNLSDCKDLNKDPLALDDEIEDMFWPDPPDREHEKIDSEPEIPDPSSSPVTVRYLICGLCNDDKIYESGAQLQLHTNKMHGPPNPQAQPPQKVPSSTKSSDKTPSLKGPARVTSSLEEEKVKTGSIIKARRILHPTRTKPPLITYSRKQPPHTSGKKEAKGNDILCSEDIDVPRNTKQEIKKWSSYDCPICPAVKDYELNRFIQHLAIHQRRPYRCTVCSELLPEDEAIMEKHWEDKHSNAPVSSTSASLEPPEKFVKLKLNPGQIWKCDGCPSAFLTDEGRDNHELRCSILQEKNLSKSTARKTPLTPIECSVSVCKQSSRNMEEWRLHRALYHPEEHRTCCTYCDKSFMEKTVRGVEFRHDQKMIEHIKKDHKGLPSYVCRIFDECESCGVVFKLVAESEAHFLDAHGIPNGDRTFSCPICHVKYSKRSYMLSHIKKFHFQKEPLICHICGKIFSQKDQDIKIIEHRLNKHGIQPQRPPRSGNDEVPLKSGNDEVPRKSENDEVPRKSGNDEVNTSKETDIFSSEDTNDPRNALQVVTKWSEYDCPICPAVKDYGLNRFLQHLDIHQRRPYRCTVCFQLFPEDEAIREEHWKDKHSDAPIPSTSSPLEPPEKFVKLKLTPGQIWKCDGCCSAFITEEGRDNHESKCSLLQEKSLRKSTVPIQCLTCKKSSRNMEEWRLHRAIHHPEINRTCCIFCDKSFVEKTVDGFEVRRDQKMTEHIQKDHKGLPHSSRIFDECESCGVSFNLAAESEAHFLDVHGIPIGERKFSCPICPVKVTRRIYLHRHIKGFHFRKEASVCDICGMSFRQENQDRRIAEHKLQKHGILPEWRRLNSCLENGYDFKTLFKRKLDLHSQRDHGGARMYTCKHCGKGFMDSSKLKQHELMHENKLKKPYQCEICGNSFAIRNYLYIHKRLSHEGRTFPSTNRKRVAKPGNQPPKRPRVAAAVSR